MTLLTNLIESCSFSVLISDLFGLFNCSVSQVRHVFLGVFLGGGGDPLLLHSEINLRPVFVPHHFRSDECTEKRCFSDRIWSRRVDKRQ